MKLDPADRKTAIERLTRLFQYLAELQKLRTPPRVHMNTYSWQLDLNSVPESDKIERGEILPPTDDGEVLGDDFILALEKPEDEEDPGYGIFEQFLELWSTIERESEKVELILGEGQLLLSQSSSGAIHHPLLLQKLTLEFDPEVPRFTVRETDREPFLYTSLLRSCNISEEDISWARTDLQKAGCHPLGGQETTDFLQRVQEKLFPDGKVIESPEGNERAAKAAKILRSPVLYLGNRSLGFSQAIERYIEILPNLEEFPPALLRVVGIETESKPREKASDLLMTMPSNPEQERVARRLEESSCVLVQGPPGTGKTHTIANLIGHLLAQGKSILVTSHAAKALRVVRDMVIPELRPLCVSVLDQEQESRKQLEAAVKGIVARFTTSDVDELESLAETYQQRRKDTERKLSESHQALVEARRSEYEPICIGDREIHPARAAREVAKGKKPDWLPGPIEPGVPLPLDAEELEELYRLNREVPAELEDDLEVELPPLEEVLTESDFRQLLQQRKELLEADPDFGNEFWAHQEQTEESLQNLRDGCERVVASIGSEQRDWALECMRVGRSGGSHQETWEELVRFIELTCKEIAELEALVLKTGATISSQHPPAALAQVCKEIIDHLKADKNITRFTFLTKPLWKEFIYSSQVNGQIPQTPEDCEAILAFLQIKSLRESLKTRWERQMVVKGAPEFDSFGEQPEQGCLRYCQPMRDALDWDRKVWRPFEQLLEESGVRWTIVEERVPADPSLYGEFIRIRQAIENQLKPAIKSRLLGLEQDELEAKIRDQERMLAGYSGPDSGGIVDRLRQATSSHDLEAYSRAWNWLAQLYSLQEPVQKRNELLGRLAVDAPEWAEQLRNHAAPHDTEKVPGDAEAAWNYMQWSEELSRRQEVDFDKLQQEIMRLRNQLRTATAHYVENKTWANQLRRTGVRQQQALVGWLDLMRKIGSGKGKRAPRLKAMAREKLADCRDAVPVWIMPLARLAESYHPGEQMFDVVILDEASQCEVTGLLAFAMGREVLVVGDHEQVSPEAVGLSFAAIEALIEEFLSEIPNRELYDGRTSVYDLARQSFGGTIRLLEHFRCVNEIIAFSNSLCYQGEIQPLRESSQVLLKPPTVCRQVTGAVYERKVNQLEAQTVAALVVACCEQPEYEGADIGVISLVGEEQALAIDKLLMKHLDLVEYQERRIVCGNAAQFQGDERKVIFLTVVETADSGPLSLRSTEVFVKRFNVAASRAKDQMWVVHSLNPAEDLKEGDLRLRLIEHAQDPQKTLEKLEENREVERSIPDESPEFRYQIRVRRALEKAGYRVHTNKVVGNYKLDMVVEGRGGRVAITCDGANEHPPERLSQDLEREAVLERLGWRFLRARASAYYLDPEKTVEKIMDTLEELDLEPPEPGSAPEEKVRGDELRERVLERAEELLREWGVLGEEAEAEEGEKPAKTKPATVAERLEKKLQRIRSLSGDSSGEEADSEEEVPDSDEDGAGKPRRGADRKGKRLKGWRNLLPLQKGKTKTKGLKKPGRFKPLKKKGDDEQKKTDTAEE